MSQIDEVRSERTGAAAVLTIDRPARRNAVDGRTAETLKTGYESFLADDDARVLILTGAGDVSFCAGPTSRRSRPWRRAWSTQPGRSASRA